MAPGAAPADTPVPRGKGRILVIRGGAIGDFILTLPALAALRQGFPETRIEVLGYPHIASLAVASGFADAVQSIEARALAGFFARNATLDERLGAYFGSFGVAISYLYDPDEIFQTNFARCSKAQFIQGPHRPDENRALHATEVFLKPLERLAIFDADPRPRIHLPDGGTPGGSESIRETGNSPAATRLALHPGSGSERKNWPEENWAALLRRITAETNWHLLLAGGEAEGERLVRLASLPPTSRVTVARNLPLPDLARQLRGCCFFLGHDSGITHLAAAAGLNGFALWGETNADIWAPRGGGIELLHAGENLALLGVDEVFQRLSGKLAV